MSHYTMLSKYCNCTHLLKIKNKLNSGYFVGIFNKTIIPLTLVGYEMITYSQLSATHLVGYLPSHIQCAPVE